MEKKEKKIESIELKIDDINLETRRRILEDAYYNAADDDYDPSLVELAIKYTICVNILSFKDENEEEVFLSFNDGDVCYNVLYSDEVESIMKDVVSPVMRRKIEDIRNEYYRMIELGIINIQKVNNASKYDQLLDKILNIVDKYENQFNNLDIGKFTSDISMMVKKFGDVSEEEAVKEIVRMIHNDSKNDEVKENNTLLKDNKKVA